MVKRDLNYKVSLKVCLTAKKKALRLIVGDYRAQFGLVRDYENEILKQNPEAQFKFPSQRMKMIRAYLQAYTYVLRL